MPTPFQVLSDLRTSAIHIENTITRTLQKARGNQTFMDIISGDINEAVTQAKYVKSLIVQREGQYREHGTLMEEIPACELKNFKDISVAVNRTKELVDNLTDATNDIVTPPKFTDRHTNTTWKLDIHYHNHYVKKYLATTGNPKIDQITTKKLVCTEHAYAEMMSDLANYLDIGFDIETSGFDPRTDKLVGASFAYYHPETKRLVSYYIPCGHKGSTNTLFVFGDEQQLTQLHITSAVQKLICWKKKLLVHNAAFDFKWMIYLGVKIPLDYDFDDTMIMVKCLDERLRAGLKETMMRMFGYDMIKFEDVVSKGETFDSVPVHSALQYAGMDPASTRLIWKKLEKLLQGNRTYMLYRNVELPAIIPLIEIEMSGCSVDLDYFKNLRSKINAHISMIKAKIKFILDQQGIVTNDIRIASSAKALAKALKKDEDDGLEPEIEALDFDLNSPQQVSDLLYNKLRLAVKRTTDKGNASTGKKALSLMRMDHEVVDLLLQYRQAQKLLDAYVDAIKDFVNPVTLKVHTSIRQYGAKSGRMSQSKPSLQVLPRNSTFDIRAGFVADPGELIGEADYCQMELMMAGALSQDPVMLEAFEAHHKMTRLLLQGVSKEDPRISDLKLIADLHYKSTAAALKKPISEVTENERTVIGKVLNFLILYGGSAKGLADYMTVAGTPTTEEQAQDMIDGYFELYCGLKDWLEQNQSLARLDGIVIHQCGRKVHNPFLDDGNYVSNSAVRTMVNSLIQGECATRFKEAVAKTAWAFKHEFNGVGVRMINLVHDAIYTQMPKDTATIKRYLTVQRNCMEFEFQGVYFSVEQQLKQSMSKKDKVKIPGLIVV